MEFSEVTYDEIDKFLKARKQRGAKILSILGKTGLEVNLIFSTEVGKELLTYDINRAEELTEKSYRGTATEREKVILDYLEKERIPYALDKLEKYLKLTNEVKNVARKVDGKVI